MAILSTAIDPAVMKKMVAAALLSAEMHPDRVGERITAIRMVQKLSKAQLADTLSLDRSSLTKIESGTKGLDIVVATRIADHFGYGLDFIYRGLIADVPEGRRAEIMAELHAARMEKFLRQSNPAHGL